MAIKKVCDVCDTDKNVFTINITYDRKLDAAGSMDDEYENYDLCYKCYNHVLRKTVYEIGSDRGLTMYQVGEYIIDNIKSKL